MAKKNQFSRSIKVRLDNVRLSYPSLFIPTEYRNKWAYRANFILDKTTHKDLIKQIQDNEITLLTESDHDIVQKPIQYMALRDGDIEREGKDGYENSMYIAAKKSTETCKKMPAYCTRSRATVTTDDGLFYAGCYVNAIIEICFGMTDCVLFTKLKAIQFFKDGDTFGGTAIKLDKDGKIGEFDDFEEDDDFD